jgi:hypothetical protein
VATWLYFLISLLAFLFLILYLGVFAHCLLFCFRASHLVVETIFLHADLAYVHLQRARGSGFLCHAACAHFVCGLQACNHSGQAGQMTLVTIFTYILAHVTYAGGQPLGRDHCGVHVVQRPRATNSDRRRVEVSRCLGRGRVWRLWCFRVRVFPFSFFLFFILCVLLYILLRARITIILHLTFSVVACRHRTIISCLNLLSFCIN